uniref:Uncharacterized protein n=1 Tax=Oryza punctata TaxID=4537 RepID=A0A0E0LMZ3_ORYPU
MCIILQHCDRTSQDGVFLCSAIRITRFRVYVPSKSLSEKELLSYNSSPSPAFEVVTLPCALIGGDTLQPYLWSSIPVIVSPLTGDELYHNTLKFMQALLGFMPLAHIDDVCDAHVFCIDQPSIAGRFL